MLSTKGKIYKITNLINGAVYIGQTIVDGDHRKRRHLYLLRRGIHTNPYLQNAFNKYGESNFKFEDVLHCFVSELDDVEVELISESRLNGECYNIDNGGRGKGAVHESTRKKMSEITKRNHEENTTYRKHYLKTRVRKIICLNDMCVYDGIYKAAEALNLHRSSIQQVLIGKSEYVKGLDGKLYQFEYYEKNGKYKLNDIEENPRTTIRSVVCANTKEIFSSVEAASEKHGVSRSSILRCCRQTRKFGGRLENGEWIVWRFLEDYNEKEKMIFHRTGKNSSRGKPIKCITTGELFDTITQACEKYDLSSGNLTQTVKGKRSWCGTLKDGSKLFWEYA